MFCNVDQSRIYPRILTLVVGEQDGFYCASNTKVTWSYNGNYQLPNDNIAVEHNDNIIKIVKMTKEIVGTYECEGTDERNFPFHAKGELRLRNKCKKIITILLCILNKIIFVYFNYTYAIQDCLVD